MYVFVDESGDPGFKLTSGSSKLFVTSMIIFANEVDALAAQQVVSEVLRRTGVKPEFKFNKCSDAMKDAFFSAISGARFRARLVVVHKELIQSEALRTTKESFYRFFIRQMIEEDGGMLRNAKVIIDGSGDRAFKTEFCSYLRRRIGRDAVSRISLKDSKQEPLLQLADMVAGAVARSYRNDRQNPGRWRDMLNKHGLLQNVWEFR